MRILTLFGCTAMLGLAGCGGEGGDFGAGRSETAFVFMRNAGGSPNTFYLYRATVSNPAATVLLASHSGTIDSRVPAGAVIDPKSLRVVYTDPTDSTKIRIVNWDGTNDQLLLSDAAFFRFVGILPNGRLSYLDTASGSTRVQKQIDLNSKAVSSVAPINGHILPDYRAWNKDRSEFIFTADNPLLATTEIGLQPVNSSNSTTITSDAFHPEFAPDNTILANDGTLRVNRFAADGSRLAAVSTTVDLGNFQQVGTSGLIGQLVSNGPDQIGEVVFGQAQPVVLQTGVFFDSVNLKS